MRFAVVVGYNQQPTLWDAEKQPELDRFAVLDVSDQRGSPEKSALEGLMIMQHFARHPKLPAMLIPRNSSNNGPLPPDCRKGAFEVWKKGET